ncbi:MAG: M48 family metallopeptidase [Bacteroidia bacterium]
MKQRWMMLLGLVLVFAACTKVPITGRRQMKLLPSSTLNSMALDEYKQFLSSHTLSTDPAKTAQVKRVGERIQKAVTNYFKVKGQTKYLAGYRWEFNTVEDKTVNAWCMPGGKVVVYTGLLPVAANDDGLAVVMGHEIAHAIANHGNERMSQGLAAQAGGVALSVALSNKSPQTQDLFMKAYGVGANVGAILPFSRMHESEADEMGLIFMAMAGYNPEEAVAFWKRMDDASKGGPPEFLSTHPAHSTRIERLKKVIPVAKNYAKKYPLPK